MSAAAKESVLSLDVIDAAASKSGLTTSGADEEVPCIENKRQSVVISVTLLERDEDDEQGTVDRGHRAFPSPGGEKEEKDAKVDVTKE